jgi:hypothetical protein
MVPPVGWPAMSSMIRSFLETTTREVLVLVDHTIPEFADSLDLPDSVEIAPLGPGAPDLEGTYRAIVLAVPDRAALRRVASLLPRSLTARMSSHGEALT